jgi:phosphatidylglycerophosphatase A
MQRPRLALITAFGLGHMRPASGTWGSLPPAIVAALAILGGWGPIDRPWLFYGVQAAFAAVFALACVVQGDRAEALWGKDPSRAVADETSGQALTLLLVPWGRVLLPPTWAMEHVLGIALAAVAGAFVVFRVMDVVKPWPARQIQRLPAGWGILLDDVFAGVYAGVVMQVVVRAVLR